MTINRLQQSGTTSRATTVNPGLKGLILTGGQSLRMGRDKADIDYHGMSQRTFLYGLLATLTEEVYLSCHPDRVPEGEWNVISDLYPDMGPAGGVLSAFETHPNSAWLIVACDLPFLDKENLDHLLQHRDPHKMATCLFDATTGMPEPMIAIWEPIIYPFLTHHIKSNWSLRNLLMAGDVNQVIPLSPHVLMNANTPDEMRDIQNRIAPQ